MRGDKIFAQRIGLIGAVNLLVSLNTIILLPILTTRISIEDYGAWVQLGVTIALMRYLAILGLPFSMVRFLAASKDKEEISEGFYSIFFFVFLIALLISSCLLLISEPMAARLFNDHLWMAKICSAIILIDCCNETMYNYFRTFQQIKRYSLYVTIMTASNFIAIASLVHFGYGIAGAVMGFLLSEAVTCLLMISDVVFQIGVRIPRFSKMRDYLTFGINTVPSSVSSWAVSSSDRYVIGLLLGTSFVGYYSPGYNLGNILIIIIAPFSFILPSALSKYYDEQNVDAVRTILSQSLRYFLTLAIPSAFGISILSFSILRMLTTPEIAAQGYMITPFVAVSALIFGVYVVISHILILEKKTSALSKVWFIAAALNLGLNFMLVPSLGIIGGAITTLIAYSLALILTAYASFKYFNFPINIYFIIKTFLSSFVMSLVFLVWYPADKLSIIICVFVCAAVYFIVLFLLGGYKIKEILFFRDLVKI